MQCHGYWQPFPRSSSNFTRAVHVHQPPYGACACKRGVGPCARSSGRGAPGSSIARRPTRFARPVPARRARPGPRSPSLAAISPSSEGLSGPHHADKTNFCGGDSLLAGSHSVGVPTSSPPQCGTHALFNHHVRRGYSRLRGPRVAYCKFAIPTFAPIYTRFYTTYSYRVGTPKQTEHILNQLLTTSTSEVA